MCRLLLDIELESIRYACMIRLRKNMFDFSHIFIIFVIILSLLGDSSHLEL